MPYGYRTLPVAGNIAIKEGGGFYTFGSEAPFVGVRNPGVASASEDLLGYYNNGFLGAGGNQTGLTLGGVIGGIGSAITGLENIFHFPTARTPGTLPAPVADQYGTPANQHPILTGAGGSSGKTGRIAGTAAGTAIVGGVVGALDPSLVGLGGHRARYAPAGTKGYHMIKKGPHAGLWTRNRHRNVANIRALRRALSRAHGFERVCRKVMHFVHPGRRGRAVFRRRRRK